MERTVFRQVLSVRTEILQVQSEGLAGAPLLHLVVIPGNPGAPTFYRQFVLTLLSSLGSTPARIEVVGHAGHSRGALSRAEADEGGPVYSLDFQTEHKARYVGSLVSGLHRSTRLVLLGHSIGGLIAARLAVRGELESHVGRVVHLMSTVQRLEEGLHPLIRHFALSRPGLFSMGVMARLVPLSVLQACLAARASDPQDPAAQQQNAFILHGFLSRTVIHNVLYMARTEVRDVVELPLALFPPQAVRRSLFLFAPEDPYTPPHLIARLAQAIPDARILQTSPEVPHAFVGCRDAIIQVCMMIVADLVREGYVSRLMGDSKL